MKIALIGHGTMGKLVEKLAAENNHSISCIVHESDAGKSSEELAAIISGSDAAIDFSDSGAVSRNVEACLMAGIPLIEGTTGWNAELESIREMVEQGNGAFVFGANFSVGVNLFYRITEFAADLFAKFPEYEVFIEEQHHSRKKDSPSGTALKLKEVVANYIKSDFSVSATRAGNIPGTHRVGFDGPADQILLEHTARSREGFARGAIMAAEWIENKKGFYEFTDVLDSLC